MTFESTQQLVEWLQSHGPLTLNTRPRELQQLDIDKHAIADGDFNAAHCFEDFAKHSMFAKRTGGRTASHGIGTISRAEAEFLQVLRFENPPEIIALGYDSIRYKKPLVCGNWYQYTYVIDNPRLGEGRVKRWDIDCHITCTDVTTNQVVAEARWVPSLVEHPELDTQALQLIQPKSYGRSIAKLLGRRTADVTKKIVPVVALLLFVIFAFVRMNEFNKREGDKCMKDGHNHTWDECVWMVTGPGVP